MRKLALGLVAALLPLAAHADADQWGRTVTCAGAGPVTCSVDGLSATGDTQTAAMNTINAMSPPQPPPAASATTTTPLLFMARLTTAEQTAITQAAQSNATVMLFMIRLAAATEIDTSDSLFQTGIAAMVSAGLLTQNRATQIANLSVSSP